VCPFFISLDRYEVRNRAQSGLLVILKGHSHEKVVEIFSLYHRFGPNADRRSGAPHMYCPHIWWLIQAV
jgi:hypothetical protein